MSDLYVPGWMEYRRKQHAMVLAKEEAKAYLKQEGCCAFVGRGQCAAPVIHFAQGPGYLRFETALGIWATDDGEPHPAGPYMIALCERHGPIVEGYPLNTVKMMQDMEPEQMAIQLAESAAWHLDWGVPFQLYDEDGPPNRDALPTFEAPR